MEDVENSQSQEERSEITYTSLSSSGPENPNWEAQSWEVVAEEPDQAQDQDEEVIPDQKKPAMSPTSVTNVMRLGTPLNYAISGDAKKLMHDCAMRFFDVVFGVAKQECKRENRSKLTGDHFIQAMTNLGLHDYARYSTAYLDQYRKVTKGDNRIGEANPRTNEPRQTQMEREVTIAAHRHLSVHTGGQGNFPQQIPEQFLMPSPQMQRPGVPLIGVGQPVLFQLYGGNPPLVYPMNNPAPPLFPGQAQPVPMHVPPPEAVYPNPFPIQQYFQPYATSAAPFMVPAPLGSYQRLLMYGEDDEASTSGSSCTPQKEE